MKYYFFIYMGQTKLNDYSVYVDPTIPGNLTPSLVDVRE